MKHTIRTKCTHGLKLSLHFSLACCPTKIKRETREKKRKRERERERERERYSNRRIPSCTLKQNPTIKPLECSQQELPVVKRIAAVRTTTFLLLRLYSLFLSLSLSSLTSFFFPPKKVREYYSNSNPVSSSLILAQEGRHLLESILLFTERKRERERGRRGTPRTREHPCARCTRTTSNTKRQAI